MTTRAERAAEATRLRAQGLSQLEIAERLGVSRSYASDLYGDPDRKKALARRERYRGVCEICGKPTTGSEGRAKAPRRCAEHNPGGETARRRHSGKGPAQRDFCILIGDGIRQWGELKQATEVSSSYISTTLNRMVKRGLIVRVAKGRYRLTRKGRALADSELVKAPQTA